MDGVARLSSQERGDLFLQTAARRGISEAIIEKDFWVCWALDCLFRMGDLFGLIFKGGTSLSKVYNAIQRFSEDIDLAFDRRRFGYTDERDPARSGLSRGERNRLIAELKSDANNYVESGLKPSLLEGLAEVIGKPGESWRLDLEWSTDGTRSLVFNYPPSSVTSSAFVRPVVLIELGARSDHWPSERRTISPYASEEFPDYFKRASSEVQTLAAERTLWEKATLLHSQHHRNDPTKAARQSRHYYDVAMMARGAIGKNALEGLQLLEQVALHKEVYFYTAWARYHEARPGSLRLVPKSELSRALKTDYEESRMMFFVEPPSFDEVIAELSNLEEDVNSGAQND